MGFRGKSRLQIQIQLDLPKLKKTVKGFIKLTKEVAEEATQITARELAKTGATEARAIIEEQKKADIWPPLSAKYLQRKIREGYDERMLVRSQFYLDHINWWKVARTGKGSKARYRFGVRNVMHPEAKMPLGRLALIHEYGNGTRPPARPFWRALVRNLKRRKAFIRDTFQVSFSRIWKRKVKQRQRVKRTAKRAR